MLVKFLLYCCCLVLLHLICIPLFVALCRTAADSCELEKVPVVDESNPLNRATDTYCTTDTTGPVIEVKWENYPDVKVEDDCVNAMQYQDMSVKVRVYDLQIMLVTHCIVRKV